MYSRLSTFLLLIALIACQPVARAATSVQAWDFFELSLPGPSNGNPFVDISLSAKFTSGEQTIAVKGFYDGDGAYRVRFMPPTTGTWRYETHSNSAAMDAKTGDFTCEKPSPTNHGPVRVHNTYHFAYADGTPYKPIGTTSYGWAFQPDAMEDDTLAALSKSPFNKIRMCLLTIPYESKEEPPSGFPYPKSADGKLDFTHFNTKFFQQMDRCMAELRDRGVEADLILFNPYNARVGFDQMTADDDDRFVRYAIARFSAYRNVWWSAANEYDLIKNRKLADWDRIGKLIQHEDPYGHLRSIHFSRTMYDPTQPWVTHMSVQNGNAVADFGRAGLYRDVCPKPVVYDEICYEGDYDKRWGQLSGEEMTLRFWMGTIAGTYVGHGEVFKGNQGKMWTARGIKLAGKSPDRIAFLKQILDTAPADGIEPIDRYYESNICGKPGEYYLIYLGKEQPKEWRFELYREALSDGMKFHVDVLDTWNMTVTPVETPFTIKKDSQYTFRAEPDATIPLPSLPYMALRITQVK